MSLVSTDCGHTHFIFMGGKTLRHVKWDGTREASCVRTAPTCIWQRTGWR